METERLIETALAEWTGETPVPESWATRDDHQLPLLRVSTADALRFWSHMRTSLADAGWYPLILGSEKTATAHAEQLSGPDVPSVAELMETADDLDGSEWLEWARSEYFDEIDEEELAELAGPGVFDCEPVEDEMRLADPGAGRPPPGCLASLRALIGLKARSNWTPRTPLPLEEQEAAVVRRWGRSFGDSTCMTLLPTSEGASAAAWLAYGGWNECPPADAHVALFRWWFEQSGAEPIVYSGDVVEAVCSRPPIAPADAVDLGWQHFFFLNDASYVEGIHQIAEELRGSHFWLFWWD